MGSSCSTVSPGQQCACCAGKSSSDKKADPWCKCRWECAWLWLHAWTCRIQLTWERGSDVVLPLGARDVRSNMYCGSSARSLHPIHPHMARASNHTPAHRSSLQAKQTTPLAPLLSAEAAGPSRLARTARAGEPNGAEALGSGVELHGSLGPRHLPPRLSVLG